MAHIRKLLNDGVHIHGIGVQGHSHLETFDRPFNKGRKFTSKQEELKAKGIVYFYRICFAHPAVEGILMWAWLLSSK